MTDTTALDAVDLFAGPGGWSLAAQRLGLTEVGIENDKAACDTRRAAGHRTTQTDILKVAPQLYRGVPGLIASPPCQTFSQAGGGAGRRQLDLVARAVARMGCGEWPAEEVAETSDPRTALVLQPLRWALIMRPEWIAFEQVPTVLPVWEQMAAVLRENGYHTATGAIQAEQYGVPQTRRRAVLLARRDRAVALPTPTHSKYHARKPERLDEGVKPWVSMAEGLGWGMTQRPSYTVTGGSGHAASSGIEWGGKSVREAMIAMAEAGMPEWTRKRPATTIVGSFKPEVVAAPGYRTTVSRQNALDSVRVTVEEAGVLQSFPRDYPWQGAQGKRYQQVGNAVPPWMAEAVLREVAL
jgi:DNA (cytosine-5)-methyltransferase 1